MSLKSFKNISSFKTSYSINTNISGLKFEGVGGYFNSDTNYFLGRTILNSGFSSIFTNLTTSSNNVYTKDVGDGFSIQWTDTSSVMKRELGHFHSVVTMAVFYGWVILQKLVLSQQLIV